MTGELVSPITEPNFVRQLEDIGVSVLIKFFFCEAGTDLRGQLGIPKPVDHFCAMAVVKRFWPWADNVYQFLTQCLGLACEPERHRLFERVFISRTIEAEDFFLKVTVDMGSGFVLR